MNKIHYKTHPQSAQIIRGLHANRTSVESFCAQHNLSTHKTYAAINHAWPTKKGKKRLNQMITAAQKTKGAK